MLVHINVLQLNQSLTYIGRDKKYIEHDLASSELFVLYIGLLGCIPRLFRPILGPIVTLPSRYIHWKIKQKIKPSFDKRLETLKYQPSDENPDPQDHLQMMLRFA